VAGLGVILGAIMILGVGRLLKRLRGMPVLSQFTLYLVGTVLVGAIAVLIGNPWRMPWRRPSARLMLPVSFSAR